MKRLAIVGVKRRLEEKVQQTGMGEKIAGKKMEEVIRGKVTETSTKGNKPLVTRRNRGERTIAQRRKGGKASGVILRKIAGK